MSSHFKKQRERMVIEQLQARDISEENILQAFRQVPREKFIDSSLSQSAYIDHALPISPEQTISQPYVVAKMCQLARLSGREKVLDIGTGSGYQAAILSPLTKEVFSIEIVKSLAKQAQITLKKLAYNNVKVICADGRLGLKHQAPFDVILSAAASETIPEAWKEQVNIGGRIILPLVSNGGQQLVRLTKEKSGFKKENCAWVAFIPLV